MTLAYVAAILDRDLRTLAREVQAYPVDADLWATRPGIKNVGGTLVLHLAGKRREPQNAICIYNL